MVSLALVVAVVVVVPVASRWLLDGRASPAVLFAGAAAAVTSLALDEGTTAAAAAAVWLIVTLYVKVIELQAWLADPHFHWCGLGRLVAVGYLVVGAAWLVVARAGWEPMGVTGIYVPLTAVHFHYAGFGLSMLSAAVDDVRDLPRAVAAAVVGGPVVVASGFVVHVDLQLVGAVVTALAVGGVASLSWRDGNAAIRCSAIAGTAGTALALHWAGAVVLGTWPPLDIDLMARVHGSLNGFGLVLLGVAGRAWQRRDVSHREVFDDAVATG